MCVAASADGQQAAGQAAVLLQPGQQLFVSVDILTFYLYETRCDHERSNPRLCTAPLTARPHTATAPLASHHLLTAAISRVLRSLRQLFDVHGAASASAWRWHCMSAGACAGDVCMCKHFDAVRAGGSVEKNRAIFTCHQRKCEPKIEKKNRRCARKLHCSNV